MFVFVRNFSVQPETSKLDRFISPLTDQMVFKKEYDEFDNFFKNNTKIFSKLQRDVDQSLETIRNNNKWQELNYKDITRLLSEY